MRALISKDLDRTRKYAARVSMKYTCSRIFIQCDDEHVDVDIAVDVEAGYTMLLMMMMLL